MRAAAGLAIVLLLAGCTAGPDPDHADLVASADVADAADQAAPHSGVIVHSSALIPHWTHLADGWANFTNPLPPPPNSVEVEVVKVHVPDGLQRLTANFTRHHSSAEAFADNCRLYRGSDVEDQEAFSDAQMGNIASDGTCTVEVPLPAAEEWRAVYLTDGLDPMGVHEVHVAMMGLA